MARKDERKVSYVYVLGCPGGPHKIGYSAAPESRALAMRREGKIGVFVVERCEVKWWLARAAERYAHWLLREHHLEHEWFNVEREVAVEAARKATSPEVIEWLESSHLIPAVVAPPAKITNGEYVYTKFPAGTKQRIREVIGERGHSAFIREVVEAALADRAAKRKPDA